MDNKLKLTIVGAGSSYTPELLEELANYKERLPVKEIMLYDINNKRLEIMEGFCRRFADHLNLDVKISSTDCMEKALEGAQFVDTHSVEIWTGRTGDNGCRRNDESISHYSCYARSS